ncbi:ABC transporter permease subunit [Neobacillus sp. SAB-20_R2A]|uniref:ABC transporter permease subunit n=1 Tax=Neobacillus sp. SAB-20_R2A TaxID=3120519 RepID=UPI003C6DEE9A
MKRLIEWPVRLALMVFGFLFVFNLPSLIGIGNSLTLHPETFWKYVKENIQQLIRFGDTSYIDLFNEQNLPESYAYTMSIFASSLVAVIVFGLLAAMFVHMMPKKIGGFIKRGINFFEGVPDLMVIFIIQFFVITLYRETGLKFLQLYGVFGARPYVVPVITVSFLPAMLFAQFVIKVLEEEKVKDYVQYSRAKGLSSLRILIVHMLPNTFPLFILQLRTSIWVILSNIFLIEFLFTLPGLTDILQLIVMRGGSFLGLVICLLLFILPLLVIEVLSLFAIKAVNRKESASI